MHQKSSRIAGGEKSGWFVSSSKETKDKVGLL